MSKSVITQAPGLGQYQLGQYNVVSGSFDLQHLVMDNTTDSRSSEHGHCNSHAQMTTDATNLPLPAEGESENSKRWFENVFFKNVAIGELLALATVARKGNQKCRFGTRHVGGFNAVISFIFEDGVEWVAKIPKVREVNDDDENEYLMSEYATLTFLQEIDTIPTPKVYGSAFTRNNPLRRPYIFMDKVSGVTLLNAIDNGLSKQGVHQTLRQLAEIRKALAQYPFSEVGSLTITDLGYGVDKQLNIENFCDIYERPDRKWGPFESSVGYYANIHHRTWVKYQKTCSEPEDMLKRWKIHAYIGMMLSSYIPEETGDFILAHTDLSATNILVDEKGSITGIIDWEFSTTLPFQSAQHYPLLLANEDKFVANFLENFEDPHAELKEWKEFYAKQFDGDSMMEDYLKNIKNAIAFEKILHGKTEVTIENLVEKFKFLESTTLDEIGLQFPWTKSIIACLGNGQSSLQREIAVQTEVPETSPSTPSIHLLSESPSLNDMIYQSSRFEHFTASNWKRIKDVSGKIKYGLSAILRICMCRKWKESHDIEMI